VKSFSVVVREVNRPPTLSPVAMQWLYGGTLFFVTNSASDPDLPGNGFAFDSPAALPSGATLDPPSGLLTWWTPEVLVDTTNTLTVRVTDNGIPAKSATNQIVVRVSPRPQLFPELNADKSIELRWPAIPGRRYQVQFNDDLASGVWTDFGAPAVSSGGEIRIAHPPVSGQRFFRLLVLEE